MQSRKYEAGISIVEAMIALGVWSVVCVAIMSLWFSERSDIDVISSYSNLSALFASTASSYPSGLSILDQLDKDVVLERYADKYSDKDLQIIVADYTDAFGVRSCQFAGDGRFTALPTLPRAVASANGMFFSASTTAADGNVPTAIEARGNFLYISADSATSSDPDLFIVDISDKAAPKVLSSLDTGPGIVGLHLVDHILYAANTSVTGQLQAIDVGNVRHPKLSWTYKVPGSNSTTDPISHALYYWRGKVFLGTIKTTLPELYALDVSNGTTSQPTLLGSTEIGAGVNALYATRGLLFAATPLDPELEIFNVGGTGGVSTSSGALAAAGNYDAPGAYGNGKRIEVFNDDLFLGRTIGGDEMVLLGLSSTSPAFINSKKISHSVDGLISNRSSVFMLADDPAKEFQAWHWQASTASTTPTTLSLVQSIDLPARGAGLACGDGYIAIAIASSTDPLMLLTQ